MARIASLDPGEAEMASINQLRASRAEMIGTMRNLLDGAERRGQQLTEGQLVRFRELDEQVTDLTEQIETKVTAERADAVASAEFRAEGPSTSDSWSERAATSLLEMGSETRSVVSGSVDIPQLVSPNVIAPPRNPRRLLDILTNREPLTGNEFEFLRQTVRTNNAAPVADNATKPTSVFTVEAIQDRARVVAHLSQPAPLRIFHDHRSVRDWIDREMREGVLDGLEAQIVSGNGVGEAFTGILETDGITEVPFATDRITSLRKARTALDNIHEDPTAVVLNPADAEAIDLTREGSDGGFLSQGRDLDPVFGPLRRVTSTSVPAGVGIIADWTQSRLYVREDVRIDVDTGGVLFELNQVRTRAEGRFGYALLRPQAFAVVQLTAG
jgi:HK97 family phage major capsid protein